MLSIEQRGAHRARTRLPARQIEERISKIAAILREVLPRPINDWLADFRHPNAERELAIWNRLICFFLAFAHDSDPLDRKREVLHVLLECADESELVVSMRYGFLTASEVAAIREIWCGAQSASSN